MLHADALLPPHTFSNHVPCPSTPNVLRCPCPRLCCLDLAMLFALEEACATRNKSGLDPAEVRSNIRVRNTIAYRLVMLLFPVALFVLLMMDHGLFASFECQSIKADDARFMCNNQCSRRHSLHFLWGHFLHLQNIMPSTDIASLHSSTACMTTYLTSISTLSGSYDALSSQECSWSTYAQWSLGSD